MYAVYWKGPVLRKRSAFAQQLSEARLEGTLERRLSKQRSPVVNRSDGAVVGGEKLAVPIRPGMGSRAHSTARSLQEKRVRQATGSRQHSVASVDRVRKTPLASRAHSPVSGGARTPAGKRSVPTTPGALSRRGSLAEDDDSE